MNKLNNMKIEKITPQIAALYIGQKCQSVNSASFEIKNVSLLGVTDGDRFAAPFDGLMLHLRGLDSITEEEAREVYSIATGMVWEKRSKGLCREDWWNCGVEGSNLNEWLCVGLPAVWLYLLFKGFDLFGLIEVGLAKDISNFA